MNGIRISEAMLAKQAKLWHNLNVMKKRAKYWIGAHTKHRLRYHFVWIPKYRKRVLRGKIVIRLKSLLYEAAEINGWWIEELSIQTDHIHMLIQIHLKDTVSKVLQKLKGGTSRIIRAEFPELEEFLWGDSFWADGYFAETVGIQDDAMIKKYIREQRE
jgi:putative transposase